jgi:hypothetical protein
MLDRIRENRSEALTIGGLILLFLGVLAGALQLRPEPGLFPRIIGVGGLIVMAVVAWRFLCGQSDIAADDELLSNPPDKRAFALISPLIYGALFYVFGFYVSAGVAMAAIPWLLGYRRPWFLLALCVGTIGSMALMYSYLLDVPIPNGLVGDWIMRTYVYKD